MIDIFSKILELNQSCKPCVLVTVTEKIGDGPCTVGAKMIVTSDSCIIGTVGGGKVEYLAIRQALLLHKIKENKSITFEMLPSQNDCKTDFVQSQSTPMTNQQGLASISDSKSDFVHSQSTPMTTQQDLASISDSKSDFVHSQSTPMTTQQDLASISDSKSDFVHSQSTPMTTQQDLTSISDSKSDFVQSQSSPLKNQQVLASISDSKSDFVHSQSTPMTTQQDLASISDSKSDFVHSQCTPMTTQQDLTSISDSKSDFVPSSSIKTGMLCGGSAKLFFEYINVTPQVYIFGAGHIGKALCHHLEKLDFAVNLIDCRKEFLDMFDDFSYKSKQKKHLLDYQNIFSSNLNISKGSFVIIATHSHSHDYDVLCQLLRNGFDLSYVGVVSSRKKVAIFKEKLQTDIAKDVDLSKVYMPAGLKIGGNTPHQIAISIISEILSIQFSVEEIKHFRD